MPELRIDADWDDVEDLAEDLVQAGLSEEDVAEVIGKWADRVLPLDVLIPGPAGMIAEAVDDKLFTAGARALGKAGKKAAQAIGDLFKQDPERKAVRRAKRKDRRAKRRRRRG
jgi:hypothetical protein